MKTYMVLMFISLCLFLLNNYFHIFAINLPVSSNEESFRIMTYNTNGVSGDYNDDDFVVDFLNAIDSIQPKILALQEMRSNYSAFVCDEIKKRFPYNSLEELTKQKTGDKNAACFFSLYPIIRFYRMYYEKEEIDSVYNVYSVPDSIRRPRNSEVYNVVIDIDGLETLVICCYLKTNDYSKIRNDYSNSWIDGFDEYINGYNIGSAIRSLDAKMIRDSIAKYNLPTIVCGDMNDFEWSRTVKTISGDRLKNVWWEKGFGYGMTYDKYHLKLRIDHILLSEEIEAIRVDVPHLPFSDHYPIVADLKYLIR